jgi:tetratricopeptide (TPR) repeat protein
MKTIMLWALAALLSPGAWAASEEQKRESQQEYLSALIHYQKGDLESAQEGWQRALYLDPDNKDAEAGLERIKKLHGEPKEAAKADGKKPSSSTIVVDTKETLKKDAQGLFKGYRGVAVPVAGHQLAFLKKGDRVDVLVTFEAVTAEKRKEKVTATILQNVVVVDVVKAAKSDLPGVVQILLNPNEAQYAALSDAQGDIHIVRRAPGDTEMHPMEMASFRKLFR